MQWGEAMNEVAEAVKLENYPQQLNEKKVAVSSGKDVNR